MHEAGVTTLYAHLGEMNASVGEYVSVGESLGQVGMTGMTTGPHLHFEVRQNGSTINPLTVIAPAIRAYQESLGQAD
jgi:murein DD-endopeptidase MepM/ murein hydrolase activator NlpD